ncbi:hypothetical protein FRB97_000018 [Tulasnella sp. 331]|nr:hypothetical protein FRB97_000018 [Tulasnella sp. 331]
MRFYSWIKWYNPTLLHRAHVLDGRTCHNYLRSPHVDPLSTATPGLPGDEKSDSRIIRDNWIRAQMRLRLDQFATRKPLTLRIGTFNVNGRDPSGSLASFVHGEAKVTDPSTLPDVLVFGFQELDLSSQALIYQATTWKEEMWFTAIMDALESASADYVKQLVGMLIIVIIRRTLRPHIGDVSSTSSGQGVMWLGNKGGVAVRFRLYDTIFTFVNSHLAAFDDQVERRNADYLELRRALRLHAPGVVPPPGNLNYRIELPDHDIRVLIAEVAAGEGDFNSILEFDQALQEFKKVAYDPTMAQAFSLDPENMSNVLEQVTKPIMSITDVVTEITPILAIEPPQTDLGAILFGIPTIHRKTNFTNPGTIACAFRFIKPSENHPLFPSWLTVTPTSGIILPGESQPISITVDLNRETAAVLNKQNHAGMTCRLTIHVEHGKDYDITVSGVYNKTCFGNSLPWLASLPQAIRKVDTSTILEKHDARAPREVIGLIGWLMTHAVHEENLFLASGDVEEVQMIRHCLDTGDDIPSAGGQTMALSVGQTLIQFLNSLTEPVIPWSFHGFAASVKDRDEAYGVRPPFSNGRPVHSSRFALLNVLKILESLPSAAANVWISITAFLHFKLQGADPSKKRMLGKSTADLKMDRRMLTLRISPKAQVFAPVLLRDNPSLLPSNRMSPLVKRAFVMYFLS